MQKDQKRRRTLRDLFARFLPPPAPEPQPPGHNEAACKPSKPEGKPCRGGIYDDMIRASISQPDEGHCR